MGSARDQGHRLGIELISDILDVLERHGYRLPSDDRRHVALGKTAAMIIELIEISRVCATTSTPRQNFGPGRCSNTDQGLAHHLHNQGVNL